MSLKETWLQEDRKCPACGQITERVRGITRQNLIRLIKPRWNVQEAIYTIIIIMIVILGLLYKSEVGESQLWLKQLHENPFETCRVLESCPSGDYNCYNKFYNESMGFKFNETQFKNLIFINSTS